MNTSDSLPVLNHQILKALQDRDYHLLDIRSGMERYEDRWEPEMWDREAGFTVQTGWWFWSEVSKEGEAMTYEDLRRWLDESEHARIMERRRRYDQWHKRIKSRFGPIFDS